LEIQPKISIIVTTYNSQDTIERCLESAINQTINSIELIIVDDGSTDSTVSIINGYIEKYNFIKLLINKINKGPGYAKNKGLSVAVGEFVGFLDSDDYLDSNYYEKLYDATVHFGTNIASADIALEYPDTTTSCGIFSENIYMEYHEKHGIGRDGTQLIPSIYAASHWTGASACTKILKRTVIDDITFFEYLKT